MAGPIHVAVGALQKAGLTVIGYPGWESRSAGSFAPYGIMFHHDASQPGYSPGVQSWLWRTSSIAPCANFWVDYYGRWVVGCAGRANHAGGGQWRGIGWNQGNYGAIGVEVDQTVNEPWDPQRYSSVVRGFAAINTAFGWDPDQVNPGHKEYALPQGRKIDPWGVDMESFRGLVRGSMTGALSEDDVLTALQDQWVGETRWAMMAKVMPNVLTTNGAVADIQRRVDNMENQVAETLRLVQQLTAKQEG